MFAHLIPDRPMRTSRFADLLLLIGAAVGVAAIIGLVIGFEPAKLPDALVNIAVYKLTFVAAGGLLTAGAIVRRYVRRSEDRPSNARDEGPAEPPERALGVGAGVADVSPEGARRSRVNVPRHE